MYTYYSTQDGRDVTSITPVIAKFHTDIVITYCTHFHYIVVVHSKTRKSPKKHLRTQKMPNGSLSQPPHPQIHDFTYLFSNISLAAIINYSKWMVSNEKKTLATLIHNQKLTLQKCFCTNLSRPKSTHNSYALPLENAGYHYWRKNVNSHWESLER